MSSKASASKTVVASSKVVTSSKASASSKASKTVSASQRATVRTLRKGVKSGKGRVVKGGNGRVGGGTTTTPNTSNTTNTTNYLRHLEEDLGKPLPRLEPISVYTEQSLTLDGETSIRPIYEGVDEPNHKYILAIDVQHRDGFVEVLLTPSHVNEIVRVASEQLLREKREQLFSEP